jgi:salicylate hydroxylase
VKKILGLVQSTLKYRLMDRKPLDKWVHDSGRVTLLGDACHPMLVSSIPRSYPLASPLTLFQQPYKSQGAAMAIEDAAVLGNLLSRISNISQLRTLLEAYQDLRLLRTATAQESSKAAKKFFHYPDGPEQRGRDEGMKKTMALELALSEAESQRKSAGGPAPELKKQNNLVEFEYDADAEADKWWASYERELEVLAGL